ALVHNGIIENYGGLRERLKGEGHTFKSDTDTEVIAHLIEKHYKDGLAQAVRAALKELEGAYAIVVVCTKEPDILVAARCGSPLIFGIGKGENLVASDVPAILRYTRNVIYLRDEQVIQVERDGYRVTDLDGNVVKMPVATIEWDVSGSEKAGYDHFMLKEIHEQPDALRNTLRGRVSEGSADVNLEGMNLTDEELRAAGKFVVICCGTAWHAGLTGRYFIERFTRTPVEVDLSSEFRYRDPLVGPDSIIIAVSQSGETADTLAGIREAKARGAKVVSIVNVVGSSVARESDGLIYTQAGPEIGVASTKAYTAQMMSFWLFTIYLGRLKGTINGDDARAMIAQLRAIPDKIQRVLDDQSAILRCADKYHTAANFLFLSRSYNFPNALEGALKLKEISYIHAEGHGAGEMKHGPIALVDESFPVVCIAPRGHVYDKMVSNIQEIKARKGIIISVATEGDEEIKKHSDEVIYVPDCPEAFSPLVAAVPMQLLAYHIAVRRGCDVDQPRNLAKSVTVE
ncbi:MAG: glutamine--fructose-6-phosphate transaminase (isomerizing), partial [Candidatus Hydrogenedentes bacterium]|nr:glutamine--fructose-6-phosphate transaminase (isomerizing) [Candidatus Hydrogenedentota bacterium]